MSKKDFRSLIFLVIFIVGLGILIASCLIVKEIGYKQITKLSNDYSKLLNLEKGDAEEYRNTYFSLISSFAVKYPHFDDEIKDNIILNRVLDIEDEYLEKYKKPFRNLNYYLFIDYDYYTYEDTSSLILHSVIYHRKTIVDYNVYIYNFLDNKELQLSYLLNGSYKDKIVNYIDSNLTSEYKEFLKEDYLKYINDELFNIYAITDKGLLFYFPKGSILPNDLGEVKILIEYDYLKDYLIKSIDDQTESKDNTKTYHAKTDINFYKENDLNSNLIDIIPVGSEFDAIMSNNVFTKIKYNDEEGYVLNTYITEDVVLLDGFDSINAKYYANKETSIYKEKDINSKTLATLKQGDSIYVVGVMNSWYLINYNSHIGFIKKDNLSKDIINKNTQTIKEDRNINSDKKMVALTFDDGPKPSTTNRILDTLEKYNVVATFFELGSLVNKYPEVVKREESIGCEVGSHTYDHPNLNKLSKSKILDQMNKSQTAFNNALGHGYSIMRPPYGNANQTVRSYIDYPLIGWNVDTLDWKSLNKNAVIKKVKEQKSLNGKIILMHSIYSSTADAVEELVPWLIKEGYQLVTVSELAYYKGVKLNNYSIYWSI